MNSARGRVGLVCLLLLVAATIVGAWRAWDSTMHYGDYVFLKQLISNLADSGRAFSDAQDAINDMLFNGTLTETADVICAKALDVKGHTENLMPYHPYFILYVFAPLAKIIPAEILMPSLIVGGGFFLLFLVFLRMDREKTPLSLSLLFLALVTVSPQFSHALQGQYYVERLFLPAIGLVLWLLYREDTPSWMMVLAVIPCLLVTERTGAVTGLYLLGFGVLHWELNKQRRLQLLLVGAACLAYASLLMHFYVDNPYYNDGGFLPHSVGELRMRLEDPFFRERLIAFFVMNGPLLLLALGDWRGLLLALGVMIPNMAGNIGGAEKTGFFTHYHSLYTPLLIWAAGQGLARFSRIRAGVVNGVVLAFLLVFMGVFWVTTSTPDGRTLQFGKYSNSASLLTVASKRLFLSGASISAWRGMVSSIRDVVPEGASVTTIEWGMPMLEENRTLYFYPLGLDVADYALLMIHDKDGKHYYGPAPTYLGPEEGRKIDECLNRRLRETGYNVDNPVLITPDGRAVIKRMNE